MHKSEFPSVSYHTQLPKETAGLPQRDPIYILSSLDTTSPKVWSPGSKFPDQCNRPIYFSPGASKALPPRAEHYRVERQSM